MPTITYDIEADEADEAAVATTVTEWIAAMQLPFIAYVFSATALPEPGKYRIVVRTTRAHDFTDAAGWDRKKCSITPV